MAIAALTPDEIARLKEKASNLDMSVADVVLLLIRDYITPPTEMTIYDKSNYEVEEADPEESAEILALIDSMTEDDHEVVRVDRLIPV